MSGSYRRNAVAVQGVFSGVRDYRIYLPPTIYGRSRMSNDDLPDSLLERAKMMEGILIACATGGGNDEKTYEHIRREFMQEHSLKGLLPDFVRTYRNLSSFWPYIKAKAPSYAERREIIGKAFNPLIDHLEGINRSPSDQLNSETLQSFDPEGVHAVWSKALERRHSDPEGAITVARTLLETVIKKILDEQSGLYTEKDDLPKLYRIAAEKLNLAPNQHSEEPIKAILGGAMNLVNGIGTLRNRLSDSHGRGGPLPVRPSARHASLAVNTAGAVAIFLIETHFDRRQTEPT